MSDKDHSSFNLPNLTGYRYASSTDIPRGRLATIETDLERSTPPNPDAYPLPAGFSLVQPDPVDVDDFKDLYHAVGNPWLWFSRLLSSDEEILLLLSAPTTTLCYLMDPARTAIGLFEAQQQGDDTLEVTYFGLVPEATGKKLGAPLLEHGLAQAWTPTITRTWLHTCTFDSPQALSFYRRQGFKAFRQRLEVGPDPRLIGTLPRDLSPHIPLADFSDP